MATKRPNYRVQTFEMRCSNCRHCDAVTEAEFDNRNILVCSLVFEETDPNGLCSEYEKGEEIS